MIIGNSGTVCTDDQYGPPRHRDIPERKTKLVLSGQPTGWTAMAHAVRNFDEERVKDCKEDVDTLLVFVCLSAFCSVHSLTGLP